MTKKPAPAGLRDPDLLVAAFEDGGILLCSVPDCPSELDVAETPIPDDAGWVISTGWWFCPDHTRWLDWGPRIEMRGRP